MSAAATTMGAAFDLDRDRAGSPRSMVPEPFTVVRVERDLGDTFSLSLRPQEADRPFVFAPGQFNMLYVFGVGEVPMSISGDPRRPETLLHTVRGLGAVTRAMARLKKGDVIGVRGPFGSGWPMTEAEGRDIVVIAGGVGLAPLRPAVFHVLASRGSYGRFTLLYGARTPKDILYRSDLRRWSTRLDTAVDITVDRASGYWHGHVGVVTKLVAHAPFDPENVVALLCGPEVMMRYAIQALHERGVAASRIHVSMERNMKCAVGLCGRCQYGGVFVCRDGPVFRLDRIEPLFEVREL
jgi:NAD(P)H-flavin reductase